MQEVIIRVSCFCHVSASTAQQARFKPLKAAQRDMKPIDVHRVKFNAYFNTFKLVNHLTQTSF